MKRPQGTSKGTTNRTKEETMNRYVLNSVATLGILLGVANPQAEANEKSVSGRQTISNTRCYPPSCHPPVYTPPCPPVYTPPCPPVYTPPCPPVYTPPPCVPVCH